MSLLPTREEGQLVAIAMGAMGLGMVPLVILGLPLWLVVLPATMALFGGAWARWGPSAPEVKESP